jgi:hydroxyethylthiazole kinase-like uncharacterized protein yjeF
MMKIVTAEQMRQIDRSANAMGITTETLMENAGRLVAEETKKLTGAVTGKNFLVLAGPGNNGGDGLVAARYLKDWGANVSLYLCSPRTTDDKNLILTQERKIPTFAPEQDKELNELKRLLNSSNIVIDAIFGTGKSHSIEGVFKEILSALIEARGKNPSLYIVAVDIPSGLDADNGSIDPSCPDADATITLGYPKTGLFNFPGARKTGKIIIADIGIPPSLVKEISTELITEDYVKSALPNRSPEANKGTFGKVLIIAGSINYIGAAYLACMGAARVGAGLVTLATARSLIPILASKLTEITYIPLPESEPGIIGSDALTLMKKTFPDYRVLLLGCGIGQHQSTDEFTKSLLFNLPQTHFLPVILDADGLNTMSKEPVWWQKLGKNVILTPHPGEMARLTESTLEDVQRERISIAQSSAVEWQKIVVLKGPYTVVASPDGKTMVNPFANAALASAGTGDVLAGMIAGLAAQYMPLFDAAACGVYLHAKAGEILAQEIGNAGIIASDLLPVLPRMLKEIKENNNKK